MMSVIQQTDEEKLKTYMSLSKKKLSEMLLGCNKHIDQVTAFLPSFLKDDEDLPGAWDEKTQGENVLQCSSTLGMDVSELAHAEIARSLQIILRAIGEREQMKEDNGGLRLELAGVKFELADERVELEVVRTAFNNASQELQQAHIAYDKLCDSMNSQQKADKVEIDNIAETVIGQYEHIFGMEKPISVPHPTEPYTIIRYTMKQILTEMIEKTIAEVKK